MSYVRYQSDIEDIWYWVSHPYSEEDQMVPHTPEEESDYDPMIPLPQYKLMMSHLKMKKTPSRKRTNMTSSSVEYPQIVHLTLIHLPIGILQRLRRRTLLIWSHLERLLLYYPHPQVDLLVVMLWDPGL